MSHEAALVEAVLFLETEPVDLEHLAKITQLNDEAVRLALEHLHGRGWN